MKTIILKCFWKNIILIKTEIYSNNFYYVDPDEEYYDQKLDRFIFRNSKKNMMNLLCKRIRKNINIKFPPEILDFFFKLAARKFDLPKYKKLFHSVFFYFSSSKSFCLKCKKFFRGFHFPKYKKNLRKFHFSEYKKK